MRRRRRAAMTLIEVLCGLVLLGTVLASVCIARGRFLRGWANAERRLQATRAADAMLSQWIAGSPESVPLPGHGPLAGVPNLAWRTQRIRRDDLRNLGVVVVHLDVFEVAAGSTADEEPDLSGAGRTFAPVLTVEFLLHDTRRPVAAPAPASPEAH